MHFHTHFHPHVFPQMFSNNNFQFLNTCTKRTLKFQKLKSFEKIAFKFIILLLLFFLWNSSSWNLSYTKNWWLFFMELEFVKLEIHGKLEYYKLSERLDRAEIQFSAVLCVFQWVSCTVHGIRKYFIQQKKKKKTLKLGFTVLFAHLKIILLQCFQFSVFNNKRYLNRLSSFKNVVDP